MWATGLIVNIFLVLVKVERLKFDSIIFLFRRLGIKVGVAGSFGVLGGRSELFLWENDFFDLVVMELVMH